MKLVEFIRSWLNRYFAHEEALLLVLLIAFGLFMVDWLGGVLAPALTALIVAFILQGAVAAFIRLRVPPMAAVYLAFLLFLTIVAVLLLAVFPLIWQQLAAFVNALPTMLDQVQVMARGLPDRYPTLLTPQQIDEWLLAARAEMLAIGQRLVTIGFGQIGSVVGILIYLVLVPILVFFFLKDRVLLVRWFQSLLPDNRPLMDQVGAEMNLQIANYMRGKAVEIVIVGMVTYVMLVAMGVNFAALLAILVGFSVLVPFIGAAVVTIPVALVSFVQFGLTWDFGWVMLWYAIIQAIDGNMLVPLLFSEAVDLHPVAIIVAVLAFGGIWGFWGVFFAIPLASLIKAVLTAWPQTIPDRDPDPDPDPAPEPSG
ncbi:MAG TPA: AI-2E family transporter [Pseudomonadales bacterium]|nr:AI-2E family transporter [Pseudomonadales bacterium]